MNKVSLMAIVLCCVLSGQANAQTFLLSPSTKKLAYNFLDCVVSEGTRLEIAGESISDTVEMAKTACSNHRQSVAMGVLDDVRVALPKSPAETQANVMQSLRKTVDEQLTAEARLRLTRVRSERLNGKN